MIRIIPIICSYLPYYDDVIKVNTIKFNRSIETIFPFKSIRQKGKKLCYVICYRESNAEAVFSCKPIETNVGLSTMTVLSLYSLGEHVARVSQNDLVVTCNSLKPCLTRKVKEKNCARLPGSQPRKIAT